MNKGTYEFVKVSKVASTQVCRNSHQLSESLRRLQVRTSQLEEELDIFQIREIGVG